MLSCSVVSNACISIFSQQNDGSFAAAVTCAVGEAAYGVAFADLAGDGCVLLGGQGANGAWALRLGPRLQTGAGPNAVTARATSISAARRKQKVSHAST